MARLPWTKFQDFYLRLGFLKALVAALSPERRSATNDAIIRKLESPLFDGAPAHSQLWGGVGPVVSWYPRKTPGGKLIAYPEVAEALLIHGYHESVLYGVTRETTYKILDWGHNVEFVGRGNQITERGLLLRRLLHEQDTERFFLGDPLAWNPFLLEPRERLFFLFHLLEIDRLTIELIDDLGVRQAETPLESSDVARLTCRALFRVLRGAEKSVQPRDIPAYRTAMELAVTIARELDLPDLIDSAEGFGKPRLPKPPKLSARRSDFGRPTSSVRERRTTKNADHQTIPRVEQLVDLGFLRKPVDGDAKDDASTLAGRRRWRYVPTDACRRWAEARREVATPNVPFEWDGFARTAVMAYSAVPPAKSLLTGPERVASYLWNAYTRVARPIGHTPFDSVALVAMLDAAVDSVAIEMAEFHRLMLAIKQSSALPDHAFFASGNDLDKMFIQLKPGFVERIGGLHSVFPASEGEQSR